MSTFPGYIVNSFKISTDIVLFVVLERSLVRVT